MRGAVLLEPEKKQAGLSDEQWRLYAEQRALEWQSDTTSHSVANAMLPLLANCASEDVACESREIEAVVHQR